MSQTNGNDAAFVVILPSGAPLPVLTDEEQAYLSERVARYGDDNAYVNISDLQDIDRVLTMELMCHRWGTYLAQGKDYWGGRIDQAVHIRDLEKWNLRISAMKKVLGLDKPARDRQRGEGSIAHYWSSLLERAKYFGIMRNKQATKAVELFMQLLGMVTAYKNYDEEERREMRNTAEDVMEWADTVARPEIEEIDRSFRQDGPNAQRYWIRHQ